MRTPIKLSIIGRESAPQPQLRRPGGCPAGVSPAARGQDGLADSRQDAGATEEQPTAEIPGAEPQLRFEKSGARCYRHAFLNAASPRVRAGVGAGPNTGRIAAATSPRDGHYAGPDRPPAASPLEPGGHAQPATGFSGNARNRAPAHGTRRVHFPGAIAGRGLPLPTIYP